MPATEPKAHYVPREPQDSDLMCILKEDLPVFLERIAADLDRKLPSFVEKQLRAIVSCGDFCRGFMRFECTTCRAPLVVPHS